MQSSAAAPVKRTALGIYAHGGIVVPPVTAGKPAVCCSGDDACFQDIHKSVSAKPYDPAQANGALLDEGRLYVTRIIGA